MKEMFYVDNYSKTEGLLSKEGANMQSRSRYLLKNIGILLISNFASKFLVFILVPLYTSVLSISEYGSYDIIYSTIQLLFPILTLNISDAVMRFTMEKEKNSNEVAAIGCRILLTGLFPVIIFFLISFKFGNIPSIRGYEFFILLYFITYFVNQFSIQLAKGMEKVVDMGIAGILSTVFLLGGNILLLLLFHMKLKGFYIANIMSQFVPAVFLLIRIKVWRFPIFQKIDKDLKREMLIYCTPLIVTVLGWWVNNTADKYTVVFMCGMSSNGLLSIAYKIPSIINVVQSIFIQAWQISAIKEYDSKDSLKFYGNAFVLVNTLLSITCAMLILLTKPIAHIMYAKDFYEAWIYVPFLVLASLYNSMAGFLGPILAAKKDSKSLAFSALYGSGVNIVLNFILVYLLGVQGATIATAISSFVIYYFRKKAVLYDICIENYSVVLFTWILLIIQSIIEIYTSIWWIEIIIIIIILWVNLNYVKRIIMMAKNVL